MAKPDLAHEFSIAKRRARQLGITLRGLEGPNMMTGAYSSRPLNLIEYCLHEAAHLITLGHDPEEFPRLRRSYGIPLYKLVTQRFELVSHETADQLEIDTARVTFVAGRKLNLWEDYPDPIICSAQRNLSAAGYSSSKARLYAAFDCLKLRSWSGWARCDEQATLLATWFIGHSL